MSFDIEAEIAKFENKHDISNYEKETMMAQLMIQKSKDYIKSKIHTHPLSEKFKAATKLIHATYPDADRKIVRKGLIDIGVYPKSYILFYFLMLLLFFSGGTTALILILPIHLLAKLGLGVALLIFTTIVFVNLLVEYLGD